MTSEGIVEDECKEVKGCSRHFTTKQGFYPRLEHVQNKNDTPIYNNKQSKRGEHKTLPQSKKDRNIPRPASLLLSGETGCAFDRLQQESAN